MDRIFMDEYYEHLRADNIEAFSKERNDEYVGRAEEYKAAKSALLEGLGLEHLFDHSHELTPKEKEIWMLFDRVDIAELLARDAFAKGAYMALHFWERHSKILPNRGRVEARVLANRPQCRRNGELSAGRKEISAVCASHPAAAYRNRRAVLARPPLCGVTAHRRRNFLCIPTPFPSAIGAQPPMS